MTKENIVVDTHSFLISLDENNVPSINILREEIVDIYGGDDGKLTAACIAEMAVELYGAKKVIEDTAKLESKLTDKIETLEDALHNSQLDCEMLRDELDKY